MLYVPARHKPKFGQAGIIPGHPLTPDFYLGMNEGGGNIVWDSISKKPYNFDATYQPRWQSDGPEFISTYGRPHIDGPAFNSIAPAGTDLTIFFAYRRTVVPALYHYFFTVGDTYNIFSMLWNDEDGAGHLFINGNEPTFFVNILTAKIICIRIQKYTPSNTYVSLFRDGIYLDTKSSALIPDSSLTFNIGGRTDNNERCASGVYSFFYIKQRALSLGEIAQYFANPYCWLYNKSEQLIRSIWAVSGGSTYKVPIIMQNMNQFNGGME